MDLDVFALRRGIQPISIGRRCFDLLVCLIENRDRFVKAEFLRAEVWHNAKISPAAIPTCVRELRRLLGDHASRSKIIQSKKGRGYRFIAEPFFTHGRSSNLDNAVHDLPFVGRTSELSILRQAHRAIVTRRQGQLAVLRGEAGIGKSRLLDEFLRSTPPSTRRWISRCKGAKTASQFTPWVEILDTAASNDSTNLPQIDPDLLETHEHHSIKKRGQGKSNPAPDRHELFSRWTTAIRTLVGSNPTILVFEDVHNGDPDSLLLIAWVAEALSNIPLLIIASQRPFAKSKALQSALEDIASVDHGTMIEIQPLDDSEIDNILRPQLLHESISARELRFNTGGNPFLIAHAIRNLEAMNPHLSEVHLNNQIASRNADLVSRLASDLPAETRKLLAVSSVVGREFSAEMLAAISGQDPIQTREQLEPAQRARLLYESRTHYEFSHALLKDALLTSLDSSQRMQFHAKAAEFLRNRMDSSAFTFAIATHLSSAVPYVPISDAVHYCSLASAEAAGQFACVEAKRFSEIATQLAHQDPSTTTETRCRLLLDLARRKAFLGERKQARALLLDIAEIARKEGLIGVISECALCLAEDFTSIDVGVHDVVLERLIREALELSPQNNYALRARLMARLSQSIQWSSESSRQEEYARIALELATESGDPIAHRDALAAVAEALSGPERASERLSTIESLELIPMSQIDPGEALLNHTRKITALLDMGLTDRITSENIAYHALAIKTGQPHHIWYALTTDAMRSLMQGDLAFPSSLESHFQLISRLGDNPNVIQGYAAQRFFREVESGGSLEVLPALKEICTRFPLVAGWESALSWLFWDLGDKSEALRHLSHFTPSRISELRRQAGSGASLAMLSEVSAHIGDNRIQSLLFDIVEPLKARCATAGYGVLYYGSFARYGGQLAGALGERKKAVELLSLAAEQEAARRADLWHGYTLIDLAIASSHIKGAGAAVSRALADAEKIAKALRVPRLTSRLSRSRKQLS